MARLIGVIVVSLTLGAAVMYGVSNFRVRVEPLAGEPPAPQSAPKPEPQPIVPASYAAPALLPASVVATRTDPPPSEGPGPATPPAAAPKPAVKPDAIDVVTVSDNGVTWHVVKGVVVPRRISLLGSANPILTLSRELVANDALRVFVDGKSFSVEDTKKLLSVDANKQQVSVIASEVEKHTAVKGTATLTLRVEAAEGKDKESAYSDAAPVILIRPFGLAGSEQAPLLLNQYADSPHLPPQNVPAANTAAPVYGSYLRLLGTRHTAGRSGSIRFVAVTAANQAFELPGESEAENPANGAWDYRVRLLDHPQGTQLKIYTRIEYDGQHFYVKAPVDITVHTQPAALDPPTFSDPTVAQEKKIAKADDLTTREFVIYRSNTPQLAITVTTPTGGQTRMLLTTDEGRSRVVDSGNPTNINLGSGRDHVVRVTAVRGELRSTAQLGVRVRAVGPTIDGVAAPGFGTAGASGTDRIQIRFNTENPLNKGTAGTKENYAITHVENAAKDTAPSVTSATFDEVTNTVTLAVTGVKVGSYKVQVLGGNGKVADVFGNELAQTFETVLFSQRLEDLPSESRGVTLQTGPNVPFEEYTKFRKLQDGFNPSDKVETRVVRLYYNRDAHRVAQIVNRDVKSYNAAAVDIRRRAADRTRDDANSASDERKRLERAAAQAAVEARAAERDLQAQETRAAQASSQNAVSTIEIRRKEDELVQARRELALATSQARLRTEAAPGVEPLQVKIDELTLAIKTLDDQIKSAPAKERKVLENERAVKVFELDNAQRDLTRTTNRTEVVEKRTIERELREDQKKVDEQKLDLIQLRRKIAAAPNNEKPTLELEFDQKEKNLLALESKLEQRRIDLRATADDKVEQAIATLRTQIEGYEREIRSLDQQIALATRDDKPGLEAKKAKTELELVFARRELERARAATQAQGQAAEAAAVEPLRLRVDQLESDIRQFRQVQATAESNQRNAADQIAAARARLMAAREAEVKADEAAKVKSAEELRLREHQFRREVAAAKEDPDTYAPGKTESLDPVQQCSISVIGEGLIQIRGPIKGLNVIRTMINQLDAPVGQVRVNVHTVQVNGERAEKMERVVASIQRYLDASRFLTEQSGQMLRKAVTVVASRKAEEAAAFAGPHCTQADRDLKYLHAFFGKDFVDELHSLDSEFLKTGNKLLSLHSMDSTSLSAAMFLLALAKNNVRREIMMEFQTAVQRDLPVAEMNFYRAGLSGGKCDACFDKKFYVLAYNAQFQSFLGYFNGEVLGDDTMTPIQREFVRLAQIFKSRMITELQLKQRVMERSLLEERIGRNYLEELKKAAAIEDAAKKQLDDAQRQRESSIQDLSQSLSELVAGAGEFQKAATVYERGVQVITSDLSKMTPAISRGIGGTVDAFIAFDQIHALDGSSYLSTPFPEFNDVLRNLREETIRRFETNSAALFIRTPVGVRYATMPLKSTKLPHDEIPISFPDDQWQDIFKVMKEAKESFDKFVFIEFRLQKDRLDKLFATLMDKKTLKLGEIKELDLLNKLLLDKVNDQISYSKDQLTAFVQQLGDDKSDSQVVRRSYLEFKQDVLSRLTGELKVSASHLFVRIDNLYAKVVATDATFRSAMRQASRTRRPLDEKKLLDMLVDEVEDKFIEMLEGTRAHTANIDNYLKGLATALETDFNTQFYQPAFRQVRDASRARDVAFAQVETTTILANNRAFAKVSPSATMEFDLPKRDILITEGFKAAKAAVDEYGALISDPSFLALTRMYSGLPVSSQMGGAGNLSAVRKVLPGLSGSPDEMLMAQAGPGRKEFGAAFEALIPDPAIYAIETGTGYEIRPVLSPDGQCVVFNFNYMYTTDINREPVRPDEKHLGRVKRHFIHTDVQLSNYELREVSKYQVGLKASRTSKGVQLLEDIPGVGVLFRPLPSAESSLQQNLIYAQSTIFPTLFDLMGLRYAPAIADLDPRAYINDEWVVRNRRRDLEQRIFDVGATRVDEALRIPYGERRPDLYRSQETIPYEHPNGYSGPGLRLRDSHLREGYPDDYDPRRAYPESPFAPRTQPSRPADPLFGPRGYSSPGDSLGYPPPSSVPVYPGVLPHGTVPAPGNPTLGNPKPVEMPSPPSAMRKPPTTLPPSNLPPRPTIPAPSIPTPPQPLQTGAAPRPIGTPR